MKTTYIVIAASLMLAAGLAALGCAKKTGRDRPVVFVSIMPQAYFAERIGGDLIDVEVLVGPGQSPHSFEPTPKQMAGLAEAGIYFTVGIPFERGFIEKVQDLNPGLNVVAADAGIVKREMEAHHHHDDGHDDRHHHDHDHGGGKDPHIWLDPVLVQEQARTMCDALIRLMPEKKEVFEENLRAFIADLDALDRKIAEAFKLLAGSSVYVFHPAFGYFTDRYGLRQEAVEIQGKEPSAKQIARIIEKARKEGVTVLFVQPQFARTSAETIAKEIGGAVVPIDPLARDYISNLERLAAHIKKSFKDK